MNNDSVRQGSQCYFIGFYLLQLFPLYYTIVTVYAFLFYLISESQLCSLNREVKLSMKSAYAEGTYKNLRIQWESFLMFCEYYNLNSFPVNVRTLCLYAQFLSRSFKSVQSVRNYLSAVKTLHSLLDLKYPENGLMELNLLLRGIARNKQHVPRKASPMTPCILKEIHSFLNLDIEFDCVMWSLILFMFFLMLRKSNVMPESIKSFDPRKQLIRKDIQVHDNMLIVNMKWSKTRQFGHHRQIPIAAMPSNILCPVTAYKKMIRIVDAGPLDPLFCTYSASKRRVIPITYPVFQGRLRDLVAKTGRNAASFSSHSMRRGGIQLAFKAEVKTELIQQHGDWVSDCYKEYLTYDFEQKLSVSKKMCSTIIKTL